MVQSTITLTIRDNSDISLQTRGGVSKNFQCRPGFTVKQLEQAEIKFKELNFKTELVRLNKFLQPGTKDRDGNEIEEAALLVVKSGTKAFVNPHDLFTQPWDKKQYSLMHPKQGYIVNNNARYKLQFKENGCKQDLTGAETKKPK